MKKLLILILTFFLIAGCSVNVSKEEYKTYEDMKNILEEATIYSTSSDNYSISITYSNNISDKSYYIVVDNPSIAMYDVKILAFEVVDGDDDQVAPNAGIFDERINLVPNQIKKDEGYVKGVSISGNYINDNPVILCIVQWINEDTTKVYREFFKFSSESESE